MTKSFPFTVYSSPFTMRLPFTVFGFHWLLIIDNSLKIVNCKLKIERPKGAFDGKY